MLETRGFLGSNVEARLIAMEEMILDGPVAAEAPKSRGHLLDHAHLDVIEGTEAWGSAPPISGGCYLARFLDLVCNRIGVPMKPNFLRIWLTRYRSCEKCSAGPLSVNTAKEGGRMECWVM